MRIAWAGGAVVVGLLVALMTISTAVPVGAGTEPVTGTATTSGGNGITTVDFVYSSPGILASGTMHFDFTITFEPPGITTVGTGTLTRSDGATLTGTETSTVDLSTSPPHVVVHFTVGSGTGALAGAAGEIVLTGDPRAPGSVGDIFTMTGTLTTPPAVPTDKDQCKNGGWQSLADDQGEPFPNQGQCVSFVEPTPTT